VTRTGGFIDTVEEASPRGGTGFFIDEACPAGIAEAVQRAVTMYHTEGNRIQAMRTLAMKQRFGWKDAASAYEQVYNRAIEHAAE
jgi:glycogen synthase